MSDQELSSDDSVGSMESQILETTTKINAVVPVCRNQFVSADGTTWTYQISIIDYLQRFNMNKKMEVAAKVLFKRADPKKLSATEPNFYS